MAHMFSLVRDGVAAGHANRSRVGWVTAERFLVADRGVKRRRSGDASRLFTVPSGSDREPFVPFIEAALYGRGLRVMEADRRAKRNAVVMINDTVDFRRIARILGG